MWKLLWLFVCAALVVSGFTAVQRIQVEKQQNVVELVYDYRGLEQLASYTHREMSELLNELRTECHYDCCPRV